MKGRMNAMKRMSAATAVLLAVLMLAAVPVSAHVTIWPQEAVQGSYTVFTVRVPSEKEGTETTAVRVVFPEGVAITRFEPKPGWTVKYERGSDQSITEVTWTAEDGHGLDITEFTEFRMSGRVLPEAEGTLVWKAYQTYADGTVVDWIGAPDTDSPTPAPVTIAVPGNAAGDGHGHGHGHGETPVTTSSVQESQDGSSVDTLMLILLIASIVLGISGITLALLTRLELRRRT